MPRLLSYCVFCLYLFLFFAFLFFFFWQNSWGLSRKNHKKRNIQQPSEGRDNKYFPHQQHQGHSNYYLPTKKKHVASRSLALNSNTRFLLAAPQPLVSLAGANSATLCPLLAPTRGCESEKLLMLECPASSGHKLIYTLPVSLGVLFFFRKFPI